MRRVLFYITAVVCFVLLSSCSTGRIPSGTHSRKAVPDHPVYKSLSENAPPELKQFIDAAVAQAGVTTGYDPSYVKLDYPGGDVPKETGVCTDVIIRAFRGIGLDLQKEVHEDMSLAFNLYPARWGLARPDSNIDHRRVPNLMTYFTRKAKSVTVSNDAEDYRPGDIVTWDLGGGIDHIGIVTDMMDVPNSTCLIVHNIGGGVRIEDVLFNWRITGHYRYF